jgi:hypothetical protein
MRLTIENYVPYYLREKERKLIEKPNTEKKKMNFQDFLKNENQKNKTSNKKQRKKKVIKINKTEATKVTQFIRNKIQLAVAIQEDKVSIKEIINSALNCDDFDENYIHVNRTSLKEYIRKYGEKRGINVTR